MALQVLLGLDCDDKAEHQLQRYVKDLQAWQLKARFFDPSNYHIHLLQTQIESERELFYIEHALNDVLSAYSATSLPMTGFGARGGKTEPNLVFAGIEDPHKVCQHLHIDVSDALGVKAESGYRPNIAICRPLPGSDSARWMAWFEAFGASVMGSCHSLHLSMYIRERYHSCQLVKSWQPTSQEAL